MCIRDSGNAAQIEAALITDAVTASASTTATVSDLVTASKAATLSGINNVQTGFTLGISDSLAQLITEGVVSTALGNADADDPDIKITITDNSTSITATDLSLITAATAGTVTLSNSHTITGNAAQIEAALITDAVTAAASTTATVSDLVTASKAATLSGINNVQTGFTLGISDSLANLIDGTAINGNVTTAAGDDADIKITITDDSTSITATDLSLITAATDGTVTLSNSHSITGTGAEVKAALVTDAVTAAIGTTTTVSDLVTAADASAIATASNVTAAFTLGISDALANLLDGAGAVSTELGNADADDPDIKITITDGSLSLIHISEPTRPY